jgi:uncharacterized membrane protein
MAVNPKEVIGMAIGFVIVAIISPMAMGVLVGTTTTSWNASVVTLFQVLMPVLYFIGAALYFIPRVGKE